MMIRGPFGDLLKTADCVEDGIGEIGMGFHDRHLLLQQRPRLVEDGIRDNQLPEIMKVAGDLDESHLSFREPEHSGQHGSRGSDAG